jgi:hypothetical protein
MDKGTDAGRGRALLAAGGRGAAAGLVGVAVMTTVEKVEQAITHRPNSYVPARTLLSLLGRDVGDEDEPLLWNHAMHWGTGAVLGALRGMWAITGVRGCQAHVAHTVLRLSTDQTLENTTGVGAPPMKWPKDEQLIDIAHKAIYSVTTGLVAERLIAPILESQRGVRSH